jgi:hypothetical protein
MMLRLLQRQPAAAKTSKMTYGSEGIDEQSYLTAAAAAVI